MIVTLTADQVSGLLAGIARVGTSGRHQIDLSDRQVNSITYYALGNAAKNAALKMIALPDDGFGPAFKRLDLGECIQAYRGAQRVLSEEMVAEPPKEAVVA